MHLIIFIFVIEYLRLLINSIYLNKFVYIIKREKFRDIFINIVDRPHLVQILINDMSELLCTAAAFEGARTLVETFHDYITCVICDILEFH